jgi:PTH1 family peptidyl-tRNA hydrolase
MSDRDAPWLVVGLGKPGPDYAKHRHNDGVMVLGELAGRVGGKFKSHRARAEVLEGRLCGHRVVLARPRSYMNESGGAVSGLAQFFKVPADRIVVIHDELDIPFGTMRLKFGGGDSGHNGVKAVRASLGTGDFYRVRIGIGRPPGRLDPAAFVLRDFSAAESKELGTHIVRAADAVEALVDEGLDRAQQAYNS